MEDTLKFIDDVIAEYNERMKSQPYQINLLEEVHMHDDGQRNDLSREKKKICENAHTRILEKILRFQNQEGYIFLQSLIGYIQEKSRSESWSNIYIDAPLFKSEFYCDETSGRIDLLIWEERKYAIIFENKINEAGDQPHQIARYISYLCQSGFSAEHIFVLYLSAEGIEKEFTQTWQMDNGEDYKKTFEPRFFDLSYRYEVLPWLNEKIISYLDLISGQLYLESAIKQYIDYLNGKFGIRKNESPIIKEILEGKVVGDRLNSRLQWLDQYIEDIAELLKKLKKDTDGSNDHSVLLKNAKLVQEGLYAIKSAIIQNEIGDSPFPIYIKRRVYERICHFGYSINIHERTYLLYIGQYESRFFTSVISIPLKKERIDPEIERLFLRLEKEGREYHDWRASNFTIGDYERAIRRLKEVLEDIRNY